MSTRAHIEVCEGNNKNYIYHHCDGYPEGVGAELKDVLTKQGFFNKNSDFALDEVTNMICNIDSQYESDHGFHGDEEYYYVIDCDKKTLVCYKVPWDLEDFIELLCDENVVIIE